MLSLLKKLTYRVSPSFRIGDDPLPIEPGQRITPIPVVRMRVNPFIKRKILAIRPKASVPFHFDRGARLTVVIPYRDRKEHLDQLIPPLKRVLNEQVPAHRILVVEQAPGKAFNRGKVKNVGVHYALEQSDYFCFHDVDMIPIVADYGCPSSPLRLVKRFEQTWRPRTEMNGTYFGGVICLRKEDFLAVNGYGNDFWGWGKEDDDLFARLVLKGIVPHEDKEGFYREAPNPDDQLPKMEDIRKNRAKRSKLLRGLKAAEEDGLNNLSYELLDEEDAGDYFRILVDI